MPIATISQLARCRAKGVLLAVTVLCLCARPCRLRITPHQRTFTYLQLCVYGAHDRERESPIAVPAVHCSSRCALLLLLLLLLLLVGKRQPLKPARSSFDDRPHVYLMKYGRPT